MTASDWQEIERLYMEASELQAVDRNALLDDACAGKPHIRAEVESLLKAGLERDRFLDLPPSCLVADMLERAPATPTNIGPYRILRLLGEGGMGTVYLAQQENPQRFVALKVIKAGMASDQVLRRFDQEAEALGRLQHPGIAQILEAGRADSGFGPQPYFAMEFINGKPLLDVAAQGSMNVSARLELIAKICEAVNHAHQRGIIHRDLKPGNILVDTTGQPKILDFGVARILDSDTHATRQTDMGQLIGTLSYMSPEQALGNAGDLDIRSDVYALGMILYELLAGKLPYQTNQHSLIETIQVIRDRDPQPLGLVDRNYRGDIETIVAKALEKNREQRYASAGDFAIDIRRHLTDQPILARPPSALYQLRKFSRRHRATVIGSAAVLVALVAGVIVSTRQAVRAKRAESVAIAQGARASQEGRKAIRERDRATAAEASARIERNQAVAQKQRADTETASAKAVNEFLTNDVLAQADVARQSGPGVQLDQDLKVRTALERAASRITGKFDQQPEVEATIRDTIGQAYKGLGLFAEARKQSERALELQRHVLGEDNPKTLATVGRIGQIALDQGKYAEAEKLFKQTLEKQRRVLGANHPDTLASMANLVTVSASQGKLAEAEALGIETLEKQRLVLGREHPSALNSLNNLISIYVLHGKYVEAEPLSAQILEIRRRVLGPEHPSTLISMNNLAGAYHRLGKYSQSTMLFSITLELKRRVLGPEHPSTLGGMSNLAGAYSDAGKYLQAEALSIQTLEIRRRTLGPEHPVTIQNMGEVASIFALQSKYGEAENLYGQALQLQRRVMGPDHANTLRSMFGLANTYRIEGKNQQAEKLFGETMQGQGRTLGAEHPVTLESAVALALAYQAQGKFEASEEVIRRLLEVQMRKQANDWQRFLAESLLGISLVGQRKYAEAEPFLLVGYRGMDARKDSIPASDRYHLDQTRKSIAEAYLARGNPQEAARWK